MSEEQEAPAVEPAPAPAPEAPPVEPEAHEVPAPEVVEHDGVHGRRHEIGLSFFHEHSRYEHFEARGAERGPRIEQHLGR